MEIAGKVALITGGASGIGRATAEKLKAEGAKVVIADIDEATGKSTATDLGVELLRLDVGDPDAWESATAAVVSQHGSLDITFLNAGIITPVRGARGTIVGEYDITALETADYRRVTGVNIDGVVFGTRAAVKAAAGRPAAIVATASIAGLFPFAPDPLYTMTKHAVIGFVRALAPTLAGQGIALNAVCPGIVLTNIAPRPDFEALMGQGFASLEASEIADAVALLVRSEESGRALVCAPNRKPYDMPAPEIDLGGPV